MFTHTHTCRLQHFKTNHTLSTKLAEKTASNITCILKDNCPMLLFSFGKNKSSILKSKAKKKSFLFLFLCGPNSICPGRDANEI